METNANTNAKPEPIGPFVLHFVKADGRKYSILAPSDAENMRQAIARARYYLKRRPVYLFATIEDANGATVRTVSL